METKNLPTSYDDLVSDGRLNRRFVSPLERHYPSFKVFLKALGYLGPNVVVDKVTGLGKAALVQLTDIYEEIKDTNGDADEAQPDPMDDPDYWTIKSQTGNGGEPEEGDEPFTLRWLIEKYGVSQLLVENVGQTLTGGPLPDLSFLDDPDLGRRFMESVSEGTIPVSALAKRFFPGMVQHLTDLCIEQGWWEGPTEMEQLASDIAGLKAHTEAHRSLLESLIQETVVNRRILEGLHALLESDEIGDELEDDIRRMLTRIGDEAGEVHSGVRDYQRALDELRRYIIDQGDIHRDRVDGLSRALDGQAAEQRLLTQQVQMAIRSRLTNGTRVALVLWLAAGTASIGILAYQFLGALLGG